MDDLSRARLATRLYSRFAGLALVPFGALYLVAAADDVGLFPGRHFADAVLLPCALAFLVLTLWYRRRYGRVDPAPTRHVGAAVTLWAVFAVVLLLVLSEAAPTLPDRLIHLLTPVLVWGLLFFDSRRPFRLGYGLAALSLASVALGVTSLAIQWPEHHPEFPEVFFLNVFLGLALTLGGIADHLVLQRLLRSETTADVS